MSEVDDDFTGINGDPPNPDLWTETDPSNVMDIQNNALDFDSNAAVDTIAELVSKYSISGDFDIQVDMNEVDAGNPSSSIHYARLRIDCGGEYVTISVGKGSYDVFIVAGSTTSFTSISRSISSTKLRITRSGGVIKGYYWSGTQWEWDGNTAGYTFSETFTGNVEVILWFKQEGTGSTRWHMQADNFLVNSGTIVWPESGAQPVIMFIGL